MRDGESVVFRGLLGAAIVLGFAVPCKAKSQKIDEKIAEVDGKSYRVNLYDDGSVKVIERGIVGGAQSMKLRQNMRKAVVAITGCSITDDFMIDAKLVGQIDCSHKTND